jgi:hypothetical protein
MLHNIERLNLCFKTWNWILLVTYTYGEVLLLEKQRIWECNSIRLNEWDIVRIEGDVRAFKQQSNQTEIAGTQFVQLLKYLAIIILQDACLLKEDEEFGANPLFNHPVFQYEQFLQFQQELLSTIDTQAEPESILLQQAMPVVSEKLNTLSEQLNETFSYLQQLNARSAQEVPAVREDVLCPNNLLLTEMFRVIVTNLVR